MDEPKEKFGFRLYLREIPEQFGFAAGWAVVHLLIRWFFDTVEWIYGDEDKFVFLLSLFCFFGLTTVMALMLAASERYEAFFAEKKWRRTNYLTSWFLVMVVVFFGSYEYYVSFLR